MKLISTVFFMMLSVALFAQGITTSSFNGTVADQKGNGLAGANVVVVHLPSGTQYGSATRIDGRYNITNVRVGGPYAISVSYVGYTESNIDGVVVAIGENRKVDFTLTETTYQGDAVEVVAEENQLLSSSRTGANTNVSEETIQRFPSIERSIQDFARLAPQIVGTNIGASDNTGGTSIGGSNNRYNNVQIDGAITNDAFGLAASGTPGGQANVQPISLDAIQEFQVSIAPYDIRSGGFTGGLINAVTRSGTNNWEGSVYGFGRDQSLIRNKLKVGATEVEIGDFDELQSGFRLGGPLVKNKMFFFVSGEIKRRNDPREGLDSPNLSAAAIPFANEIISITKSQYGYDPGSFDAYTANTDDNKIFARVDWNLNDRNTLTLRHNFVDGSLDRGVSRNPFEAGLFTQNYVFESKANSSVLQLNSSVGNNMANMARVSLSTIRDARVLQGQNFPEITVDLPQAEGNIDIVFGSERSSQANTLDQDVWEFTDDLIYFSGDHTFTVGTHNEFMKFDNLFIQHLFGAYEFDAYTDENGNAVSAVDAYRNGVASRYRLGYSLTNNPLQSAKWNAYQIGLYAQDEWKVNPRFVLTYGVRADVPVMRDKPLENKRFAELFPGRSTSDVPSGNILWSPRVGFNYDATGNRETQVRGGVGIFSGTNPFVWLSNQYSNTGVDFARVDVRGSLSGLPFSVDPNNQPRPGDPGINLNPVATSEIDITAPDFKLPQVFRTNLALDQKMGSSYVLTLEGIWSQSINNVLYKDINLQAPQGNAFDGRPLYDSRNAIVSSEFTNVLELSNTSKGYQYSMTAQLQKSASQGGILNQIGGSLSYTYGQATDINSGQSSTASSNWFFNETVDPNNPKLGTSDFQINHRFLLNMSYQTSFNTSIGLFYEGRSGRPFASTIDGDANGDGQRDNDLAYIPLNEDEVVLQGGADWATIDAFLNSNDLLKAQRGQIIERNATYEPWVNQLDLRLAQGLNFAGQKFDLTFDFLNFLNLLSNDWGQQKYIPFQTYEIFDFFGYNDEGKPIIRFFTPGDRNDDGVEDFEDIFSTDNLLSRWRVQVGLRYSF